MAVKGVDLEEEADVSLNKCLNATPIHPDTKSLTTLLRFVASPKLLDIKIAGLLTRLSYCVVFCTERDTQFNQILPFWCWYTHNKFKPMAWYWIAVCLSELNENWTKSRRCTHKFQLSFYCQLIFLHLFPLSIPQQKKINVNRDSIVDPFPDVSIVFAVRK